MVKATEMVTATEMVKAMMVKVAWMKTIWMMKIRLWPTITQATNHHALAARLITNKCLCLNPLILLHLSNCLLSRLGTSTSRKTQNALGWILQWLSPFSFRK
jgi:uncharacterized membrane protein